MREDDKEGIIETIELEGSAASGQFWLGTDDPYEYLANYARVLQLKERILKIGLDQGFSSTGSIEFNPLKEDEEKKKARAEFIKRFNEDTTGIKFTPSEQKLLEYYKTILLESEFVQANAAMDYMWGEEDDRQSKRGRLISQHVAINKKLKEKEWRIKNNKPKGSNKEGKYYFEFNQLVEQVGEEEGKGEASIEDERKEFTPELEIDLEKREVRIEGDGINEIVRIPDNIEWEIFRVLTGKPGFDFTKYTEELRAITEKRGIDKPHFQIGRVKFAFEQLMEILNIEGLSPAIAEKKVGKNSIYSFNASKVTYKGEIEEKPGEFDVSVAPGFVVRTEGSWEATALKRLLVHSEESIHIEELSSLLFGDAPDRDRRALGIVRKLNGLLTRDLGNTEHYKQIFWDHQDVWIGDQIQQELIIETATSDETEVLFVPSEEIKDEEKVIEIFYTPTPEEIRSPEETKMLGLILEQLMSHTRLYYELIHKELALVSLATRMRSQLGKTQIKRYTSQEIYNIFTRALSKLLDDSKFSVSRDRWTEDDKKSWDLAQKAITELGHGSIDVLKQKVGREVVRAEREYYELYPSKEGYQSDWINLS